MGGRDLLKGLGFSVEALSGVCKQKLMFSVAFCPYLYQRSM